MYVPETGGVSKGFDGRFSDWVPDGCLYFCLNFCLNGCLAEARAANICSDIRGEQWFAVHDSTNNDIHFWTSVHPIFGSLCASLV